RRATEGEFIANYDRCAMVEERSWPLLRVKGYEGEPLRALTDEVEPPADGVPPLDGQPVFSIRHGGMFVAVLGEGEPFRALINPRAVGRADNPVVWRLYGPNEWLLDSGEVPIGEVTEIEFSSDQTGVHVLVVTPGGTCGPVTLLNDHAAMATNHQRFVYQSLPMFFYVPDGTGQFSFQLRTPGPGETARVILLDPQGNEAARLVSGEQTEIIAEVDVPAGMAGRAWQARVERADTGTLEDYTLSLGEELPAYWSHAPDRLVVPAD
ncbi:MAG: hypothetical protein ACOC7J_01195, partial [Armatimonadota bacterium]